MAIVTDGFESGVINTTVWGNNGGTPVLQTAIKHHGMYAVKCDASGDKMGLTSFAATPLCYARFQLFFESIPVTPRWAQLAVLHDGVPTLTEVTSFQIQSTFYGTLWALYDGVTNLYDYSRRVETGRWYTVELFRRSGLGVAEASIKIDGETILQSTGKNYSLPTRGFDMGTLSISAGTMTAYFDCVEVSGMPIGQEISTEKQADVDNSGILGTTRVRSLRHSSPLTPTITS